MELLNTSCLNLISAKDVKISIVIVAILAFIASGLPIGKVVNGGRSITNNTDIITTVSSSTEIRIFLTTTTKRKAQSQKNYLFHNAKLQTFSI